MNIDSMQSKINSVKFMYVTNYKNKITPTEGVKIMEFSWHKTIQYIQGVMENFLHFF